MGVTKKPSGVNIIGLGAADLNQFKPVDQLKDLYIQLTADGATEESMDYLAYLKSYAEHNQSIGLPIMPNGVNVWISNNGKTSAVEADDLSLEDGVYTICGIKCTNGTWDFSDAGQSGGGGGGGGLLVHIVSPENFGDPLTLDKNWDEINAAVQSGVMPVFIDGGGGMPTCIEVLNIDNEYDVTLLSFDTAEPRALPFVSDSATGVLTYTHEL